MSALLQTGNHRRLCPCAGVKRCAAYDPCADKDEGQTCTICDPADKDCKEPDAGIPIQGCDGEFPDWRAGNARGENTRTVCADDVNIAAGTTVAFKYKYVVGYCGKKGEGIGPTLTLIVAGKEVWKKQIDLKTADYPWDGGCGGNPRNYSPTQTATFKADTALKGKVQLKAKMEGQLVGHPAFRAALPKVPTAVDRYNLCGASSSDPAATIAAGAGVLLGWSVCFRAFAFPPQAATFTWSAWGLPKPRAAVQAAQRPSASAMGMREAATTRDPIARASTRASPTATRTRVTARTGSGPAAKR